MAQPTVKRRVSFKPEKSLTTIVHISPRHARSDSESDQEADHTDQVQVSRPSPSTPLPLPLDLRFSTYIYKEGTLLSSEFSLKAGTVGGGIEPVIRQLPALASQQDNRRITSTSFPSLHHFLPVTGANKYSDTNVQSSLFSAHQRPSVSARQRNFAGIFGGASGHPGSVGQASLQLQNFRHVPFFFAESARLRVKPQSANHHLRTVHQTTASLITAHTPSTPKTFTSIYRLASAK